MIQVISGYNYFELNGKFVGKYGSEGSNLGEFKAPQSLAVLSNSRIVD